MKLTNRSEYALLALIELARHYDEGLLSGDCLAERQAIPKRFLQQILFSLKRGGFIRSVKGKAGGYALNRAPHAITVAEIVRFFEGALAPTTSTSRNFYQPSPIEHEKGLVQLFSEIRDRVATMLETTTLSDVSMSTKLTRKRRRA
jgi:Rrf2 family cysteine metabolism transcriptional repressor